MIETLQLYIKTEALISSVSRASCFKAVFIMNLSVYLWALATVAGSLATHTNNWAVLVSTSRFWFNYRHIANVLGVYRTVKRLGIPDHQIILMLPDDIACNSRNAFPGTVFDNAKREIDLYGENIEVDYRGYEVTVSNFMKLITGRHSENTPPSKKLLTNENSNVLVYMTGHGGDEFLKFQDAEEMTAWDLAHSFEQMHQQRRYNELLFMIDTCQANTMFNHFYSPGIIAVGSSEKDQSSYSHHADEDIGVAVIDRFTYYLLQYLEDHVSIESNATLNDLFSSFNEEQINSRPGVSVQQFYRDIASVKITDFFGEVPDVDIL